MWVIRPDLSRQRFTQFGPNTFGATTDRGARDPPEVSLSPAGRLSKLSCSLVVRTDGHCQ